MVRLASLAFVVVLASFAAACGGGNDAPDATITFYDAAPPDAEPPPDAFVCVETDTIKECAAGEEGCVNITTNEQHCGGCDMPCNAGAGCVEGPPAKGGTGDEIAHCECPTDITPDDIASIPPETLGLPITAMNGIPGETDGWAGLGFFFGGGGSANGILATFRLGVDDPTPLDTDIDMSTVTGQIPTVGIGHNFDSTTFQPQGAYRATSGTLRYTTLCDLGAEGEVTDATFAAVSDFTNPDAPPVEGGCSFMASFTFTVGAPGDCPAPASL